LADPKDSVWMPALLNYVQSLGMSWTYWSLNPNSGDTKGLLLDNWTSIDHVRYDVIHPFLVPGPAPTKFVLTVTASGSGTVTSAAAGINCGAACGGSYLSGTSITLTATPTNGSTFAGWSGACTGTGPCTVAMTATRPVTATFTGGNGPVCSNPITFTNQSGNFNTTGPICLRTSLPVNGWGCSNFDGRTVSVNGQPPTSTCGGGAPIPPSADGFRYFIITAGAFPYASLFTF
jgi:endoglucanase